MFFDCSFKSNATYLIESISFDIMFILENRKKNEWDNTNAQQEMETTITKSFCFAADDFQLELSPFLLLLSFDFSINRNDLYQCFPYLIENNTKQ